MPRNSWNVFSWIGVLILAFAAGAASAELPPEDTREPVAFEHFPDALHAVVWRNWGLVEPSRLAEVLRATPAQVTEIAASMGLPDDVVVPPEFEERGYITLLRRNWHLLPFDQLCQLLNMSGEELAFRLREDDFLFMKVGSVKPRCEPVHYAQPSEESRRRAAEIKKIAQQEFANAGQRVEPRFAFLNRFESSSHADISPQNANSSEEANANPRFIYSYCAMYGDVLDQPHLDPYPGGLLEALKQQGVNGVWLHVVLRQLAPGGEHFPEFGEGHERRLKNLRTMVAKAKRHGIDVYLYINEPRAQPLSFFESRPEMAGVVDPSDETHRAMCTSDARVREWMSDALAHVFREVPGLGGVFTITASENHTNCATRLGHKNCPRCKDRKPGEIYAEVNRAIEEGVHRSAPEAKVILWDWGWQWLPRTEEEQVIGALPRDAWLMSVSEWNIPIERGGVKEIVGEYSMSTIGPGERAQNNWRLARERGMKTVAKIQVNNTWELSSVPALPVMDLVGAHARNLAAAGVDGTMFSWTLGGYPSLNMELVSTIATTPDRELETVIQELAERHFGQAAAPHVRSAWKKFSTAFEQFPFDTQVLYMGPQQFGPANLLFGAPTGYRACMCGIPYDDLERWRGPYPVEVFISQMEKVADGWKEGLADLDAAASLVPEDRRAFFESEAGVARCAWLHFASSVSQARFIVARDALRASNDAAKAAELRQEMLAHLGDELTYARELYRLASADSRLGYEASNHYFYVPHDLIEKVINCDYLRRQLNASVEANR